MRARERSQAVLSGRQAMMLRSTTGGQRTTELRRQAHSVLQQQAASQQQLGRIVRVHTRQPPSLCGVSRLMRSPLRQAAQLKLQKGTVVTLGRHSCQHDSDMLFACGRAADAASAVRAHVQALGGQLSKLRWALFCSLCVLESAYPG